MGGRFRSRMTPRPCLFLCLQARCPRTRRKIPHRNYSFALSSPHCSCSIFAGCSLLSTKQLIARNRKSGLLLPLLTTRHQSFRISGHGSRPFLILCLSAMSSSSDLSLYILRSWRSRLHVASPNQECPILARL